MSAIGHPAPGFYEVPGADVRVGLAGGEPDPEMISFHDTTGPEAPDETWTFP